MTEPWRPDLADCESGFGGPLIKRVYGQVYHYTDLAGLVGMVGSGVLWATSLSSLNDTSELAYGLKIVREEWAACERQGLPDRAGEFINQVLEVVASDDDRANVFAFSASAKDDLLNQWAHYGGTDGFELAISTKRKFEVLGREPAVVDPERIPVLTNGWGAVLYRPKRQRENARRLLERALHEFNRYERFYGSGTAEHLGAAAVWQGAHIKTQAALWKDPAFYAEKEVRYVTALTDAEAPRFRASGSSEIPYVELRPKGEVAEGLPFLIGQVRLGPEVDAQTESDVRSLLAANGLETLDVWRSKIPYASRRT